MTDQEAKQYRKLTASIQDGHIVSVNTQNVFLYIGKYLRCLQPVATPPEKRQIGQIVGIIDNCGNLKIRCIDIDDNSEWYVRTGAILPNPQCVLRATNSSDRKDA